MKLTLYHQETTYRNIYGNKLATPGKQKVEEQRKLRAISGQNTFEAFHWGLGTKKYWTSGEQSSTGAFLPMAQMFLLSQLCGAFPTYNAHKFPTAQQLLSMFIKTFKITVSVLGCTTIQI